MKKNILYGLALGLLFMGCNQDNGTKTKMEELREVVIQTQKEQCKIKLSNDLPANNSAGIKESKDLKIKCDGIMKHIGQGEVFSAFEEIKRYTWISDKEIDIVYKGTEKHLKLTGNRYGSFVGYEFIKEENISKSLRKFTYIAKCENHPLVWTFIFYKAKDKWTLNVFNWHDKIQKL